MSKYGQGENCIKVEEQGLVADSFETFIDIAPATTLTDGTTYFSMRNTGTRTALIRSINLVMLFTGTAAATASSYGIARFNAATPTTGTTQTAIKKKNSAPATTMGDIRFNNTGLSTTSVVFETHAVRIGHMSQLAANPFVEQFTQGDGENPRFELAPGEGVCIRANGTLIAGTRVVGSIAWDEKG